MKGLELCRQYWAEIARPALERAMPEAMGHLAAGLVGEGSECFGFDDEISRDHDWGPGVCLWLSPRDMARCGPALKALYAELPAEFRGFRRLRESAMTAGRVGVLETSGFYLRHLGLERAPNSLREWRLLPESGLAAATNGEVFEDSPGEFTATRNALLAYYPEDVRRKKLAARCAAAAQAGQYNYLRSLRRGERVAAFQALSRFVDSTQSIVFLLNRRYMPFYKWSQRALRELPVLGAELAPRLDALTDGGGEHVMDIEQICAHIIAELRRQGLSDAQGDFLLPHAESIREHIADEALRAVHLLSD